MRSVFSLSLETPEGRTVNNAESKLHFRLLELYDIEEAGKELDL